MKLQTIRAVAIAGLILPLLYIGSASAAYLLHARMLARATHAIVLPAFAHPLPDRRILIFSPHCDDEMLGCGGLIQQAALAHSHIKVAFITNGDGFRVAVERQYRTAQVAPKDYVRFADLRQRESLRALGGLGLDPHSITFLGYPDRGVLSLWRSHWTPNDPYTSPYTQSSTSPYAMAYHPGVLYCGQNLLSDLCDLLRAERPTDVYITHPADDHPDHMAASAFVTLALQTLNPQQQPWVTTCRLHYYLVHRGAWPTPPGVNLDRRLLPPPEMENLDTRWESLPLTPAQERSKLQGILTYASQTAIMKRFLVSFARNTELFGSMPNPQIPHVPSKRLQDPTSILAWRGLSPVALDAVNDSLLRNFQSGGDITGLYACTDTSHLYVRVDTAGAIPRSVTVQLFIRYFGTVGGQNAGGSWSCRYSPADATCNNGAAAAAFGSHVVITVPLRDISYCNSIALDAETSAADLLVDRTGYRFYTLQGGPVRAAGL